MFWRFKGTIETAIGALSIFIAEYITAVRSRNTSHRLEGGARGKSDGATGTEVALGLTDADSGAERRPLH
jgi:hypothetical protein